MVKGVFLAGERYFISWGKFGVPFKGKSAEVFLK